MNSALIQKLYGWVMSRIRPVLFLAVIYVRDSRSEVLKAPPDGYTARFVNRDELLEFASDGALGLTPDFIERAFLRSDVCTGMFHEGRLIAYMWRSTGVVPHARGICVETRKPYRYGYKALTLTEYRGQHIPEYLAPVSSQYYIERGYSHSIGFVETHNLSSRKSEERRGSINIGYAGYLSLLSWRCPFRTQGVRKVGFRFISAEM